MFQRFYYILFHFAHVNIWKPQCPMRGPISAVFSDIYMCKMEEEIVKPLKPIFYKRYVDGNIFLMKEKQLQLTCFSQIKKFLCKVRVLHNW